jgi:hypothetical protein
LSIELAPSEWEMEGMGPGEEAAVARELGGGRWISAAATGDRRWQLRRKEGEELGRMARREADRAAWAGWQVG